MGKYVFDGPVHPDQINAAIDYQGVSITPIDDAPVHGDGKKIIEAPDLSDAAIKKAVDGVTYDENYGAIHLENMIEQKRDAVLAGKDTFSHQELSYLLAQQHKAASRRSSR